MSNDLTTAASVGSLVEQLLGQRPRRSGGQLIFHCVLCDDQTGHLYVDAQRGVWKCHKCGAEGNLLTLMRTWYQRCLEHTTPRHYKQLASMRPGIPAGVLRRARLALDGQRWLIPYCNLDGAVVSLRWWQPGGKVRNFPGCTSLLFGLERLNGQGPVWLCEGEWDSLSLEGLADATDQKLSVIGLPGANVFRDEWLDFFRSRDCVLALDNDSAGQSATTRLAERLQPVCQRLSVLQWPADLPAGIKDIRDYAATARTPRKAWHGLLKLLQPLAGGQNTTPPTRKLPLVRRFSDVLATFRKTIYCDEHTETALSLVCAVVLSAYYKTEPLWLFLVAPPGGGKTLLLRCLDGLEHVVYVSTITPHLLVSGYGTQADDPSLLPLLGGKCLVLKDYTEVLSMPWTVQEELFGVLRGCYDGHVYRRYGNGIVREYKDCWFSLLAGTTQAIETTRRASLGERFLRYNMVPPTDRPERRIRAAMRFDTGCLVQLSDCLQGFLKHLHDSLPDRLPPLPTWFRNRVILLAQLVAYLRAEVSRDSGGGLVVRPQPEVATRLAKQLCRLAQLLAVVYGTRRITHQVYGVCRQVALDTCGSWAVDIVDVLAKTHQPLSREQLAERINASPITVWRVLRDLVELGVVIPAGKQQTGGRPADLYQLSKKALSFYKKSLEQGAR